MTMNAVDIVFFIWFDAEDLYDCNYAMVLIEMILVPIILLGFWIQSRSYVSKTCPEWSLCCFCLCSMTLAMRWTRNGWRNCSVWRRPSWRSKACRLTWPWMSWTRWLGQRARRKPREVSHTHGRAHTHIHGAH